MMAKVLKSFLKLVGFSFIACVGILISYQNTYAQGYLRFKENKGQWNQSVRYRAQLPNGYIYLRNDGITYSFLSAKDMHTLRESMHGTYEGDHHASDDSDDPHFDKRFKQQVVRDSHSRHSGKPNFESSDPLVIHGHAYQVNFLSANKVTRIVTDHEAKTRYNYLIGDRSQWGQNVRAFGGVTYKNLYPNIDMHIYSNREGLKYDLIVHPGGDFEDIQFEYEGADDLYVKRNQLYIKTSVGTNIEVAPYSYQVIDNKKVLVKCKYHLDGNILSFKVGAGYHPGYPLMIDPNFIFASYSGSHSDNWGYTATYDAEGNFYMGGIVFGTGYPVTPGAFQTVFAKGGNTYGNGGFDISISKLSPDGKRLIYATYLGGGGDEQPHSFIVNKKGQLIISGRTNSTTFPGTLVGDGGNWDMILTELTADGSNTVGSLIIGGSGKDGVNIADKYTRINGRMIYSLRRFYGDDARSEVNIDKEGNIILVGSTQSKDFPVTSGVFQPTSGGEQDAIVLKAAPDLSSITWASFLGGSENDAAYVLDFAKNDNIYVAGGTESGNFPGASGNVIQNSYAGRVDGFIAEITADGKQIIRSTFLGTEQADQIYGIQTDKSGDVYVGGTTEGVWDDVFPGKVTHLEGVEYGKQFICKFNSNLSTLIYSSTFGSSNSQKSSLPNISPTAFLVDRCRNVYMSGWGGSIGENEYPNQGTFGLPKVNPLNLNSPDGRDFYFIAIKKGGKSILFADTYGQNGGFTDHVDGGTSRFDPNGVIYQAICANCGGGTIFPTGPPGVYSRQNGSLRPGSNGRAQCNVVGFKIAFNLDGVRGRITTQNGRSRYCIGDEITFIDSLYGRPAKSWSWEIFDEDTTNSIYGPITTDTSTFSYKFKNSGAYIVRLVKNNPGDCIAHDTTYIKIRIGDNPADLNVTMAKLPPCDSYKYRFVNLSSSLKINPIPNSSFVWNFGDETGNITPTNDTIIHHFPEAGSYKVRLTLKDTKNFCNTPIDTTFMINASSDLEAKMEVPGVFCHPGTHPLMNVSIGGTNYLWIISKGGNSDTIKVGDARTVFYDFKTKGQYLITLAAEDTVCKMKDRTVDTVLVYPKPTANFSATTSQPPNKTPINAIYHFKDLSQSNFNLVDSTLSYQWYFGDGRTSTDKNPLHLYAETGEYNVMLIVTNPAGCSDTAYKVVKEKIVPALDVPSAFTPGSHDINGYARPQAFGVVKIDFRIYNRLGELVFHSTDPAITYIPEKGWDGMYKGKPQVMDAYAYVVKVVFGDGTKANKTGSITLIR